MWTVVGWDGADGQLRLGPQALIVPRLRLAGRI